MGLMKKIVENRGKGRMESSEPVSGLKMSIFSSFLAIAILDHGKNTQKPAHNLFRTKEKQNNRWVSFGFSPRYILPPFDFSYQLNKMGLWRTERIAASLLRNKYLKSKTTLKNFWSFIFCVETSRIPPSVKKKKIGERKKKRRRGFLLSRTRRFNGVCFQKRE